MCYSLSWAEKKTIEIFKNNNKKVCHYCGKKLTKKEVTVDHLVPVAKGGKTKADNLVICCHSCNEEKAYMDYDKYMNFLEEKKNVLNNDIILKEINSMIDNYTDIINTYDNITKELKEHVKEKNEIEKIIKDIKCNASEGYMLFRDLKNRLITFHGDLLVDNYK